MKNKKASSKSSAKTQPKTAAPSTEVIPSNHVGLALHVERWVKEKAKAEDTDPCVIVNTTLDKERKRERDHCNPPFHKNRCYVVADWTAYDNTWERLWFDDETETFYLEWSWCDPADVPASEALLWYGQKRMMECEYGELDWRGLHHLIKRAARDLREWEEVKTHGVEGVKRRRQEAYAKLLEVRVK